MTPERLKYLTELVNSNIHWENKLATRSPDLPLELQEILANSKDGRIRYWLAFNKPLYITVQEILVKDHYNPVRYNLANCPNIDISIQKLLASDTAKDVRWGLARNPSFTNRNLWELLRNDEDEDVREEINKRIEEEKDRIKAEFKEKIKL